MSGEMSLSTEVCILAGLEEGDDAPLSEILLNALECPVCMEYMVPPIVLCESGHNICDQCRPKLPICPACRRPFLEARNIALETLAQGLRYPCRNRHLGCPEVYPMSLISKHHLICQHRPYECPLKVPGGCSWKGQYDVIMKHVIEEHERFVMLTHDSSYLLENLTVTPGYTQVIFAHGEIFLMRSRLQKDKFHSAVQQIGAKSSTPTFLYEFRLLAEDGVRSVSFSNLVYGDSQDIQTLNNAGNCVRLDYDVIRRFMYANTLPYKLRIDRIASGDSGPLIQND